MARRAFESGGINEGRMADMEERDCHICTQALGPNGGVRPF